jgi:hypothetical protein
LRKKEEALRLLFARGNKQFHDGREQVSVVQQRSQSTRLTTTGRDRGTLKTTDDFDVFESWI